MIEVRDADTDALVTGAASGTLDGDALALDADAVTAAGTFDCDTEHAATLTSPPAGYEVVDGADSGTLVDTDEDGTAETLTLVLTVQEVPAPSDPAPGTDPGTDPEPDTGVGGDDVVCEGRMEVIVIGPGGGEIDGPVTLDGEQIMTPHDTGTVPCGAYTTVLDVTALPDGVTLGSVTNSDTVGPDSGASQQVTIEDGDDDQVVFVLALSPSDADDPQPAPVVEVSPDAAPGSSDDTPAAAAQDTADELPRTGTQHVALLVLAVLMLAGGGHTLRLARRA